MRNNYTTGEEISKLQKKLNDAINDNAWKEKECIRLQNQIKYLQERDNIPPQHAIHIEHAFTAVAKATNSMEVSVDVDHEDDDIKPSITPQQQVQQLFMAMQQERRLHQEELLTLNTKITLLEKEKELSKAEAFSRNFKDPPSVNISTTTNLTAENIKPPVTATINKTLEEMLEKYDELDDDSKKMLTQHAITTDNADLQRRIMALRTHQGTNITLAKLTKEIIKLADTYKVPELRFDEQASKRRFNFQNWIMKLRPILAMFPQTASVLPADSVVHFTDPHNIGNKALYLLLCSRTDAYFQRAVKKFEPFGDKALELIQKQCAHISRMDKHHFHEVFMGLRIREHESATSFLKCFTYAKTTAEDANNTYTNEQLVDYVFAGLRSSSKDVYKTALQLYQLERRQGKIFTLSDVEQNFFEIDEDLGRDKKHSRTEQALAISDHRQKRGQTNRHPHNTQNNHRPKPFNGRCPYNANSGKSSANAATGNQIICFNCGTPGHTAPKCPHGKISDKRHTRPLGKANAAQSANSSDNSTKTELVCMANIVHLEQAFTVRRTINYADYPNLPRPRPQPIPAITTDFTGAEITNTVQYVTLALPISLGEFNDILESHLDDGLAPIPYVGQRNPLDDDLWIMLHSWPLAEQDRSFAAVCYPQLNFNTLMSEAIIPALGQRFGLCPDTLPLCFERWKEFVRAYVQYRFDQCPETINSPVTVTCRHITLCLTFYPTIHEIPVLIQDNNETYITTERTLPAILMTNNNITNIESANMAIMPTESAFAIKRKDPSVLELGDPGNLLNYLPDSGATQHMTPRRADLFDEVEGQNLGVEVADGHVIKCSITGKIQLNMLDDNGNKFNAVLNDVMYVPGLSRRLFSITRFAKHGHFSTIKKNSTTLYFGSSQIPVTLPVHDGKPLAADISITNETQMTTGSKMVPWSRNHDHSNNSKRHTSLELLHKCLGHRKCRALLAASEHAVWADTIVRMGPKQ